MKKQLLFLLAILVSFSAAMAQGGVTGVSTTAEMKKSVVEEFTGVRCPNCPPGHVIISNMIAANPNDVVVVAYHPNNSSYTPPYSGDEDFQRAYAAAFYSTPFAGSGRFMPSAFINRREWSAGEKITSRGAWDASAATIRTESSPMNVGILANYNEATSMLDVTVEVYYTADVTDLNSVYVHLTEDGLVTSQQSGASGPYTHSHTFREGMAAQWGDPIATTTTGSMASFTYQFDNTAGAYDMNNCNIVAFVENKTDEEIYTGAHVEVLSAVSTVDPALGLDVQIFPNPVSEQASVVFQLEDISEVSYTIHNLVGAQVANGNLGVQNSGSNRIELDTRSMGLTSGVYLLKLNAGELSSVKRIVVQ